MGQALSDPFACTIACDSGPRVVQQRGGAALPVGQGEVPRPAELGTGAPSHEQHKITHFFMIPITQTAS
jgi:hypothetical protein